MSPTIFIGLCAAAVAGLLYAEYGDRAPLRRVFKPAASAFFILAGLAAGALDSPSGQAILAGLVFCALGDVLLMPKSGKAFLAGMGAFAVGHGAYFASFLIGGAILSPAAVAAFVLMAALSIGLIFFLRQGLGAMRTPVAVYSLVISIMVAGGVAHWSSAQTSDSAALAVAAAGFALSDVSVARDRFGGGGFINRAWGLPLYYAAQCLFAVSV